jgi:uncharacterized repeat protein (TIGR01451 family)
MTSRIPHFSFRSLLLLGSEKGQVAIIVGLLAVVLFGAVALVVDTGAAYETRRSLQNGADAAALAGVMELAEGRGNQAADAVARQYVVDNLSAVDKTDINFPTDRQVMIRVEKARPTFFARIFGVESIPVAARATASTGVASEVTNLMPLIVPQQRVGAHTGALNEGTFVVGEDRPLETFSILYDISGNRVTYTVTYINNANNPADMEVWSPVPAGATYVDGSATSGGILDGAAVRWYWPGVIAGDSRQATYVVEFGGAVDPANSAYASANGGPTQTTTTDSGPQMGFFWLSDFDASAGGTPDFADWIINGYPNPVSIGAIASGTGVKAALKTAMAQRLARDASVILPLYDYTEGGGHNGEYRVIGFAEFFITGFDFNGNPKTVTGYFTSGAVTSGFAGGPAADYGVKAIWLSE